MTNHNSIGIVAASIRTSDGGRTPLALPAGRYEGVYCGYEVRLPNWQGTPELSTGGLKDAALVVEVDRGIRGACHAVLTVTRGEPGQPTLAELVEGDPARLPWM